MARNSFRDPVTGILRTHGFIASNGPSDVKQVEADDFSLEPGKWKWNGSAWVAFTPPTPQHTIDVQDAWAKLDDAVSDVSIPPKIRAVFAAIRKISS